MSLRRGRPRRMSKMMTANWLLKRPRMSKMKKWRKRRKQCNLTKTTRIVKRTLQSSSYPGKLSYIWRGRSYSRSFATSSPSLLQATCSQVIGHNQSTRWLAKTSSARSSPIDYSPTSDGITKTMRSSDLGSRICSACTLVLY